MIYFDKNSIFRIYKAVKYLFLGLFLINLVVLILVIGGNIFTSMVVLFDMNYLTIGDMIYGINYEAYVSSLASSCERVSLFR